MSPWGRFIVDKKDSHVLSFQLEKQIILKGTE